MSINNLINQHLRLTTALDAEIAKLQERLTKLGLTCWWGGNGYKVAKIGDNTGARLYLDDNTLKTIIAMSDKEFSSYFKQYS